MLSKLKLWYMERADGVNLVGRYEVENRQITATTGKSGSSADAEMNSLISEGGGGEKTGALTPSSYRWSGSAEGWLMIHKQCTS